MDETNPAIDKAFNRAISFMESGDFDKAAPILERLATDHPTSSVLWNLGLAAVEIGDHEKAKRAWLLLRKWVPQEWRTYSKLIQAHQALGEIRKRDAERKALFQLWKSGKNSELSAEKLYCREQFEHKGKRILVLEYFAPSGEYMVKYAFVTDTGKGEDNFRISLGSYEGTNQIARELGEIPRNTRLYHLDLYHGGRHETHGFYKGEPSYDQVRADVANVLEGSIAPLSFSNQGGK